MNININNKRNIRLALLFMLSFVLIFISPLGIKAATESVVSSLESIVFDSSLSSLVDSDGDGYSDEEEIMNNYSPYNKTPIKLDKNDADSDGLNDSLELQFKTDPLNQDSDGDNYKDGDEVYWGYNPLSSTSKKMSQKIIIDLKNQKLKYLVSDKILKDFSISSGKASMKTPKGSFKITNKNKKAWSNTYKLWMPYWLGLGNGSIGIHELPLWPSGYREGENHLGKPVSHGCVRLGIGAAQYIYERVGVGTNVVIN